MNTLDLTPLFRATIGFDRLTRLMESALAADAGYPPYNIEKLGEDQYRLTMAVAGFSENDLEVTVKDNALVVTGRAPKDAEPRQFLHRGIARRAFERRFELADHIVVEGATLENGLLHIALKRVVPESLRPRQIPIGRAAPQVIETEAKAAA
ncbi:Hsp20 family protein [Elioraea thermophila]|uniref:Hsp20 family protein n=1 Tax=Elioraea thermophila TaxID=2185104 RepID=UPI000DF125B6|nr:Hsp20 family protein [Elioraea thermophila]MCS6922560.1 Hsp20 family protein [Elioraea sp.]